MLQKDKAYHRRAGSRDDQKLRCCWIAGIAGAQHALPSLSARGEQCSSVGAEITPTLNVCTGQISNSVRDRSRALGVVASKFLCLPPGPLALPEGTPLHWNGSGWTQVAAERGFPRLARTALNHEPVSCVSCKHQKVPKVTLSEFTSLSRCHLRHLRISAYWLVSRRMHGRLPKNSETPRALHPLDPGLGDDVSITRNLFRDAAAHRVRTLTDHVEPECAQFFAEFRPLQAVHQNGG